MNLVIGVVFHILFLFAVLQKNGVCCVILGSDAISTDFPSAVSIMTLLNQPVCAGTLVKSPKTNRVFVITSALCVNGAVDNPKLLRVVIGDLLTFPNTTVPERQIKEIEKIIVHSQYGENQYSYNIGIIHLKGETKLTQTVKPIQIADRDFQNNANCRVAGWGSIDATNNDIIRPKRLQYAYVNTVPRNSTDDCYIYNHDNILIAHETNGACGPWNGDYGAGLICDDSLAGIFLFPLDCNIVKGYHFYTGYYTEVYQFRKWIEANSAFAAGPQMFLILAATLAYFTRFVM